MRPPRVAEPLRVDVEWVDVREHLRAGQQPVFLLERARAYPQGESAMNPSMAPVAREGEYWVPQDDVTAGDPASSWAVTRLETHVRVPVFAYRTAEPAVACVWGLGLHVGLAALHGLRLVCPKPVVRAVLVLGHECTDLRVAQPPAEALRCYVGVAIEVKP